MKIIMVGTILKALAISIAFSFIVFSAIRVLELGPGIRLLAVQSGSMAPAIPTGSLVVTRYTPETATPVNFPRFFIGEIITFTTQNGMLVSHRIVDVKKVDGGYFYQTKGDANQSIDLDLVSESNVVGQLVYSIPYMGRIQLFAKQPVGFVLLVLIPCLYVIIFELITIVREVVIGRRKANQLATV